jgi:hypothetical protein
MYTSILQRQLSKPTDDSVCQGLVLDEMGPGVEQDLTPIISNDATGPVTLRLKQF